MGAPRIGAMIALLVIIGVMMQRARDPHLWSAFLGLPANRSIANQAAEGPETTRARGELPDFVTPEEWEAFKTDTTTVHDRAPMNVGEMPAYWRLLKWSGQASLDDMNTQARRRVPFTHLWESPEEWRGELIQMTLHVRRVLSYENTENPDAPKTLYEAWGFTDESQPFPYVVVFSELPPDLPVGPEVQEEISFVGFYLKNMSYKSPDASRAAPLLLGRVTKLPGGSVPAAAPAAGVWSQWLIGACMLGLGISLLVSVRRLFTPRPRSRIHFGDDSQLAPDDHETSRWLGELGTPAASSPAGDASPPRS